MTTLNDTLQRRFNYLRDERATSPQRMGYSEAMAIAEIELRESAGQNGLIITGAGEGLAVELNDALAGWRITWAHNKDGALVYVAGDLSTLLDAQPTITDAYNVAMAYQLKRNKERGAAPTPEATSPTIPSNATGQRRRVYVCHAYSSDPAGNAAKVAEICKVLVAEGVLPIAPQVYLASFVDDATQRDLAMSLCLDLLAGCDELLLRGPELSAGMIDEVRFALRRGIPIRSHVTPKEPNL